MARASRGINAAQDPWQPLQRGLALALEDVGRGRDALHAALALFEAHDDAISLEGRLITAAALVQFIGIADDHYGGFEHAVEVVNASLAHLDPITDPDHRLLARSGALVAGWFRALDDPRLAPLADAITRELGDEAVSAPVRCCAGLAVLAFHVARSDLEKTLWVELAMRQPLASPNLSRRLLEEWRQALDQALYECAGPVRSVALRTPHENTAAERVPATELKRALVEAQIAIGEGRVEAGHAALARAEPWLNPRAPRPAFWWHFLRSRLDLTEGRHHPALTHARLAVRLATECQFPERWMGLTVMQEGHVQMANGACLKAVPFFERAGRAASGLQADFCWCLAHFARALGLLDAADGAADTALALAELKQGLELAQRLHWLNFFRAGPTVAARICALGLEHGIETAFVHEVIHARSLDAVRPDLSAWPWPIRVLTLGRFQIELGGERLAFAGKVAKKPLELLQFIIASGGADVSATTVMFALWRELEGDKARSAFNVALHRLRKLLGNDDAVVLELGRVSLNPKLVWVDCLAFELLVDAAGGAPPATLAPAAALGAQRALAMYGGHFLHETEDEPWQMVCRSRLASKFKRTVTLLARHGAAAGETRAVRTLLERALELDPLAEDIARELMRLLSEAGEQAAALNVFEHCRAAIAQGLNAKPASTTLALVERIRLIS
jgi:LuxR family transcriptional regulator, maltose regulon positive regulatory protein